MQKIEGNLAYSSAGFELVPLPWSSNDFGNFMTKEDIDKHYNDIYARYVYLLNEKAKTNPEIKNYSLAELSSIYLGQIGKLAKAVLNHIFFWNSISPNGGNPGDRIYDLIIKTYVSMDKFKEKFLRSVIDLDGSGWIWLVYDPNMGFLEISTYYDNSNPIDDNKIPLLVLDLWEHSYYCSHGGNKEKYVNEFWNYVNWHGVREIVNEQIIGETWRTT